MQITIVQLLAFFARNIISIAQLFFLSHYFFPTFWIRASKEQANGIIALLELRLLLHAYSSFRYEPQKLLQINKSTIRAALNATVHQF